MVNEVTDEVIIGCGFINVNTGDLFKCGTTLYPSSTKAKLVAIFTALLTIPENTEIKIYMDSQVAIDGITKALDNWYHSRLILTLHNHSILFKIIELVKGKSLVLELIKVKGYSDDVFNDEADKLAKEAAEEALLNRFSYWFK